MWNGFTLHPPVPPWHTHPHTHTQCLVHLPKSIKVTSHLHWWWAEGSSVLLECEGSSLSDKLLPAAGNKGWRWIAPGAQGPGCDPSEWYIECDPLPGNSRVCPGILLLSVQNRTAWKPPGISGELSEKDGVIITGLHLSSFPNKDCTSIKLSLPFCKLPQIRCLNSRDRTTAHSVAGLFHSLWYRVEMCTAFQVKSDTNVHCQSCFLYSNYTRINCSTSWMDECLIDNTCTFVLIPKQSGRLVTHLSNNFFFLNRASDNKQWTIHL